MGNSTKVGIKIKEQENSSKLVHQQKKRFIGWKLISLTKQSLKSDTFIYVVGTIIANVQFFTLEGRW